MEDKNKSFLQWSPQYEVEERHGEIKDYREMIPTLRRFEEAQRHKYSKMTFFKNGSRALDWYYEKKSIGSPDMSIRHHDVNFVFIDNKSVEFDKDSYFLVYCAVESALNKLEYRDKGIYSTVRMHHEESLTFKRIGEIMKISTATASWMCGRGEFYIEGILDEKGLIMHYADFSENRMSP